jgi:hypothetical protein
MEREVQGLRAMAEERFEMVGKSADERAVRPDREGGADEDPRADHGESGRQGADRACASLLQLLADKPS